MKLVFIGGKESDCTILKEGKKYIYFRSDSTNCKYRLDKESGIVQISPYWNKEEKLKVIM